MASGTANDEVRILSPSESGSAQTGNASNVNRIDRFIQKGEEILETFVSSIRSFEGQALKIKDLATSVSEIQANLKRNNDESSVASRPRDCAICAFFMQIAHLNEVSARQVAHLTIFSI
jgi:hypothetical protein